MDKPFQPFWSWSECRTFIEAALSHYKNAPAWFRDYLEDLYIRLGDGWLHLITLDEIASLQMLHMDNSWKPEMLACNHTYKLLDRLGRDTTGIMGY